jgi:hypothetical protein
VRNAAFFELVGWFRKTPRGHRKKAEPIPAAAVGGREGGRGGAKTVVSGGFPRGFRGVFPAFGV